MGELSASVRLKLERANEHAEHLKQLVADWSKSGPYRFATAQEDDADPDYVRLRYFIEVTRALPIETLSKITGDCIHNFRCVLDHLIWELSVAHSGPSPPNPLGIKFPGRLSGAGASGLHAVDAPVVAAVKALHDRFAGTNPEDPPTFFMLCELSNVDKHSTIHVVHHYARDVQITVAPVIIGTLVEPVPDLGHLEHGTVVARIAIPRPYWDREIVAVRCRTENGVVIAKTPRTPMIPLGIAIDLIKEAVEEAAEKLRQLLP